MALRVAYEMVESIGDGLRHRQARGMDLRLCPRRALCWAPRRGQPDEFGPRRVRGNPASCRLTSTIYLASSGLRHPCAEGVDGRLQQGRVAGKVLQHHQGVLDGEDAEDVLGPPIA